MRGYCNEAAVAKQQQQQKRPIFFPPRPPHPIKMKIIINLDIYLLPFLPLLHCQKLPEDEQKKQVYLRQQTQKRASI